MPAKPPVLCILGPTASGKTALAEALVNALPGELVSVDSTLVYRGLDIGAARPASSHHLLDLRDPAEPYSAAAFLDDLADLLPAIVARGRVPVLVGGTMLYFRAFLEGLSPMPPADPAARASIAAEAAARGWPALHAELAAVDPASAARIHPNHAQRLARALEVYRSSGRPLSAWHGTAGEPLAAGYRVLQVALCPADRAVLHARIAARFDAMLAAGFLEEVAALRARGDLDPALPALRSVGYRQLWAHLAGEADFATARERAIAATRQLAKRQLTWLRKWPDLYWLLTDDGGRVVEHTLPEPRLPVAGNPADLLLNYLAYHPI
ncbi:tRNA (adenosine(37)-N6)-dimethylallyltransferase MiaA [Pseudohaliea sp.]|uniref:tRNA (adenosine(37)-N6)-dimethylallyltransferase MiaA n=1 Tax=Pseudohaliea sp. TaxID=2740289 RepID=UPI0032EFB18A